jgi:hypothetical protein
MRKEDAQKKSHVCHHGLFDGLFAGLFDSSTRFSRECDSGRYIHGGQPTIDHLGNA